MIIWNKQHKCWELKNLQNTVRYFKNFKDLLNYKKTLLRKAS